MSLNKTQLVIKTGKVFGFILILFLTLLVGVAIGSTEIAGPVEYDEFADVRAYDSYLERYYEEFPEKDPCNTPGVEMLPFDVC